MKKFLSIFKFINIRFFIYNLKILGSLHRLELSEFYRHLVFKQKHDEIGAKLEETHDDGFSSDEDWVGKKPKNVGFVETVYDNWGTSSWEIAEAKIEIMNNTKGIKTFHLKKIDF